MKKLVGTKYLNTKQYSAGLSSRIRPHHLPKHLWEDLEPRIYSFPSSENPSLLNFFLPLPKVSFLLPSNSNFHLITIYKLYIWLQSLLLYHFFSFMYTWIMLILINQCLLDVVFSMIKALNGQSSPKQNLYSPHLSMLLGKPCFSLWFFSSFSHFLFYFKLYKISTDHTPVGTFWHVS